MVVVFAYPVGFHTFKHGPRGYSNYKSFKPWLRDEYIFKCVYCLSRETWYPDGMASFGVDHVVARNLDASLECEYENLVLSCNECNSVKQNVLLGLSPISDDLSAALRIGEDFRVEGASDSARELVEVLRLNAPARVKFRQMISRVRDALLAIGDRASLGDLFGFPADLPDLAQLAPPSGNGRPEGVDNAYFAIRARGELPELLE